MREEIAREAIRIWGATAQVDMMIEECSELILALQHWRRGRSSAEHVAGEIADVQIMMDQARVMFGQETVDSERERKIVRLVARLEDAERKS